MDPNDGKPGYSKNPDGIDNRGVPYRVIVVDDEEINRLLIAKIARSVGYDVVAEAADGFEALEQFKYHRPDLVTLDVQMPRMNGVYTLKALREIDPEAVVVMLTTIVEKDIVLELLKGGASDYVVKPIDRVLLLEKLRGARKANATRFSAGAQSLDDPEAAEDGERPEGGYQKWVSDGE